MNHNSTAYLLDKAIKMVKAKMDKNPTIPPESMGQLIIEQYNKFLDVEDRNDDSAKYETTSDDNEPHTPEEMEKADAYWESLRKGEDQK